MLISALTIRLTGSHPLEAVRRKHREFGLFGAIMGTMPAIPNRELPRVELPREVYDLALWKGDELIRLTLKVDRVNSPGCCHTNSV